MAANDYLVPLQKVSDLPPPLQAGLDYWDKLRGDRPFPARADIDPTDIPKLLPQMELVEVLEQDHNGVPDFRYRLVGTGVDGISLQNNAGRKISDIPHQRPPSQVHSMFCMAVTDRAPITVKLPYVGDDLLLDCVINLVAPLSSDGMTIDMLFSIVAPIWRKQNALRR